MSLVGTECSDLFYILTKSFIEYFYEFCLILCTQYVCLSITNGNIDRSRKILQWAKWAQVLIIFRPPIAVLSKLGRDYSKHNGPIDEPLHYNCLSTNILLLISYLLLNCVLYFFLTLYVPPHQMYWVIYHSSGGKIPITCLASMSHCIPNLMQHYVGILILSEAFVFYYGLAHCDLYWILLQTPFYVCLSGFGVIMVSHNIQFAVTFPFFNQKRILSELLKTNYKNAYDELFE